MENAQLQEKLEKLLKAYAYYFDAVSYTHLDVYKRQELAPSHIRVNAVAPGCIDTDMVRSLGRETMDALAQDTPLGRLGTPEDIAAAVAFLAGEDASFITGQVLTADGGFIG